ncbi:hypothetical protein HanIR_Chr09g0426021 [Helianthus annuus]|nr:hypothetical protein HanIR_Chr15g0770431 [Helianthus annuus]KAJ0495985.1 hypothetical protein HanIR_Chr12g0615061 [Helianthus annuus]KAJ0535006.1 hypothetical protein HanIR_Chr09g0426021 [Helianthus annuus]
MSQSICIYQCKLTYFSQKVKCRYYTKIGWLFPKSVHYSLASSDDKYLLNNILSYLYLIRLWIRFNYCDIYYCNLFKS